MPDGLYDRDILTWSEQQAALLRRLAAGEGLNDGLDWTNLIDEVESVGLSELHRCESMLTKVLVHLLKLHAVPDSLAVRKWRGESLFFVAEAKRSFSPSMRQQPACRHAGPDRRVRSQGWLGAHGRYVRPKASHPAHDVCRAKPAIP